MGRTVMPQIENAEEAKSVARLIQAGQIKGPQRDMAMQALREFDSKQTQPVQAAAPNDWEAARNAVRGNDKYNLFSRGINAISEPISALASGAVSAPISGLSAIAGALLPGKAGQGAEWQKKTQEATAIQPRTPEGQTATKVVSYPFEKLAQLGDAAGGKTAETTNSPGLGALVNTAIQAAPALLFSRGTVSRNVGRTSNMDRSLGPSKGEKAAPNPASDGQTGLAQVSVEHIPSKAELAEAADAAYKRADDAGIIVKADKINTLKKGIASMAKGEGINPTLHPDTTAALKQIVGSKGDLTLTQLETLRKVAKDAAGSLKPADKRLAGKVVDQIDDFIDNLDDTDVVGGDAVKASALKEARALYTRKKKADVIDNLRERAELSAPNFSASGLENSLRTEFRNLAKNERKMRLFTAEEQAAIKRVAIGGKLENALRFIGKFAPTGVVSSALSGGLGAMIAGPAGVGIPLAGIGGRALATRMTKRNVQTVDELVRRGPTPRSQNASQAETALRAQSLEEATKAAPLAAAAEQPAAAQRAIAEELLRQRRKKGK